MYTSVLHITVNKNSFEQKIAFILLEPNRSITPMGKYKLEGK